MKGIFPEDNPGEPDLIKEKTTGCIHLQDIIILTAGFSGIHIGKWFRRNYTGD